MRSASTANSWRWPRATDSSKWRRLAWIERVAYGDSQVSSCRSKIWRSSDNLTIQAQLPKIFILAQELARLNSGVAALSPVGGEGEKENGGLEPTLQLVSFWGGQPSQPANSSDNWIYPGIRGVWPGRRELFCIMV